MGQELHLKSPTKERRRERPLDFFDFFDFFLRPGTSSGTYSISILSFSEGNEFF
jgi:hypothetical protein